MWEQPKVYTYLMMGPLQVNTIHIIPSEWIRIIENIYGHSGVTEVVIHIMSKQQHVPGFQ